tara:strand:- start:386150 stop:386341 length:192 start_codon:yes stop_codon:yes gene_type:complete
MKPIFFSLLVLCLSVSISGCSEQGPEIIDGVTESEIEKYNRMVAESDADMMEGEKAKAAAGVQ